MVAGCRMHGHSQGTSDHACRGGEGAAGEVDRVGVWGPGKNQLIDVGEEGAGWLAAVFGIFLGSVWVGVG